MVASAGGAQPGGGPKLLAIIFDDELDRDLADQIRGVLSSLGLETQRWRPSSSLPVGAHAVVTSPSRVVAVGQTVSKSPQRPRVIAAALSVDERTARELLSAGVAGVVACESGQPVAAALAIVAAATGHCAVLPLGLAKGIASQLDQPRRPLTDDEQRLLGLASIQSIEAAGRAIGLSRRQAQRRYQLLCPRPRACESATCDGGSRTMGACR